MTDERPKFAYDPNTSRAFDLRETKSIKIVCRIVEEPTKGNTMTTYPIRADWWREVTDPDEVIPAGCPVRKEPRGNWDTEITETVRNFDRERSCWGLTGTVFIDSRWTPPRPIYKVGDVIEECTPDNLPPDGVAIVDAFGDVGQLDGTRLGWACGGGATWGSSVCERFLPYTVIYVPKVGGDA